MATGKFDSKTVRAHNKQDDLWVVINRKVYNLSKFINEHPGGREPLLEVAGKDATKEFYGHSREAKHMMKNYYIGDLVQHTDNSADVKAINGTAKSAIFSIVAGTLLKYGLKRLMKL